MSSLYDDDSRAAHTGRADWFSGVEAVVAEVDASTYSVKVIITSIDEDVVFDEWVPVYTPYVGPPGFGFATLPEVGSEVSLYSRGNEGLSLFAVSRYSEEEYLPPAESLDGSHVWKTSRAMKLLADLAVLVRSGQAVTVQGASRVDTDAPSVRLLTEGTEMFRVEGENAGFRGAAIARRTLPTPGPTDTPLTIALRQLLIDLRLAQ